MPARQPTFDRAPLASIHTAEMRAWHAGVAERVSPLPATDAYQLLRTILNTAVRNGLLAVKPCNIEGGRRRAEAPTIRA